MSFHQEAAQIKEPLLCCYNINIRIEMEQGKEHVNFGLLMGFIAKEERVDEFSQYLKELKDLEYLKLNTISIQSVDKLCHRINSQRGLQAHSSPFNSDAWKKGQFKLFLWFILYFMFVKKISPEQLVMDHLNPSQQDHQLVRQIFASKSVYRLMFEVKLFFPSSSFENWTQEEIELLKTIVVSAQQTHAQKIQWKLISYQLFEQSQGHYYRPYSKCRERWTNHINPTVIKKNWTIQEDIRLIQLVQEIGKKWATIAQHFGGTRTDHMIKNRYNSHLSRQRKYAKGPEKQLAQELLQKLFKQNSFEKITLKSKKSIQTNGLNEGQVACSSQGSITSPCLNFCIDSSFLDMLDNQELDLSFEKESAESEKFKINAMWSPGNEPLGMIYLDLSEQQNWASNDEFDF